jgi:hypothetical protein
MQNLEKARKLYEVKDSESDTWTVELKNSLDQVKMYGPDTESAGDCSPSTTEAEGGYTRKAERSVLKSV